VPAAKHFDGGHCSRILGYDGNPIVYDPRIHKQPAGRSNYRSMESMVTGPEAFAPQALPVPTNGPNSSFRLPNNVYHVPGYQGFIPGMQYRHGDTFAKTSRKCNDIPRDLYLTP